MCRMITDAPRDALRNALRALAMAALLCVNGAGAAEPDAGQWTALRALLFGDRQIREDSREVIQLSVASRAEDAAVVPVTLRTRIDQTPERYIRHIWLVIDNNPSPMGVKFTLTPESGRADIETRVRLEHSSPMRAIAELNDGSLWMHSSVVFGSGGCSAPVAKNEQVMRNLGRMKISVESDGAAEGEPLLAHLRVSHPQFSGVGVSARGARFVRQVNVFYGARKVLSAELDFTISENPSFRFYFLPTGKGELRAEVVDTEDLRFEQSLEVGSPGN
jgi:sulfur-oxidizing protein SoxY